MENNWIEIFKTGTHAASNGKVKPYSKADLDRIVQQYNSKALKAPIVIGEPTHKAAAYGWVKALKRVGGTLFFKAERVVPEFAEMVKSGVFKERVICFHPDSTLRYVGFMGAEPPVFEGLKDIVDVG